VAATDDKKAVASDALKLEIDGPGVHPETLDPLATLELGRAYLRLLNKIADEAQVSLEFKGLGIEDKCAALVFPTDKMTFAEQAALEAHRLLGGQQLVPHRLEVVTDDFRAAVRALPKEQSVTVLVGARRLPVPVQPQVKQQPVRSITKLRTVVLAVGGKQPTARFLSKSEGPRPFTVRIEEIPVAQQLGAHLFLNVDAEVQVERDNEGTIVGGKLLGFVPVGKADDLDAWRAWYKSAALDWDNVEDIEHELGRDDDSTWGADA